MVNLLSVAPVYPILGLAPETWTPQNLRATLILSLVRASW